LNPGPYRVSAEAAALHRTLLLADLHADTLLWGRDILAPSNEGHIDLPRLVDGNVGIQGFTVFSTVPRGINIERNEDTTDLVRYIAMLEGWPVMTIGRPKRVALYQASRLRKFVDQSNGGLILLRTRGDLERFVQQRQAGSHVVAALLGTEGAQPLEGDIRNLDELYAAGFRMMSPSHFTDTAVGGSAAGASKGGLTALGREWVKRMEARGMLIDVGVVGAAHVGLGSDFDGAVTEPFDPSGLALITEALLQQGLSEHDIQLVMGENVARVLGQILPE